MNMKGHTLLSALYERLASILDRDGHELYFHDVCLQYLNDREQEHLIMSPKSDPSTAFTVTRSTNSDVIGNIGFAASQIPSANVSLAFTRSTGLSVEYTVSSWSISSHQVGYRKNSKVIGYRKWADSVSSKKRKCCGPI